MSVPTPEQVFAASEREAAMRPEADRLVTQYQRGLVTVEELSMHLALLDGATPDVPRPFSPVTDCCEGCANGERCLVPTLDAIPTITGIRIVDLILAHSAGRQFPPALLEGDRSGHVGTTRVYGRG